MWIQIHGDCFLIHLDSVCGIDLSTYVQSLTSLLKFFILIFSLGFLELFLSLHSISLVDWSASDGADAVLKCPIIRHLPSPCWRCVWINKCIQSSGFVKSASVSILRQDLSGLSCPWQWSEKYEHRMYEEHVNLFYDFH